jgi:histidinol phosphatase-like enzyme
MLKRNPLSEKDFNHVEQWLRKKLEERGVSIHRFTLLTGFKISNASIHRWFRDVYRPSPETMKMVCETLSKLPIIEKDGSERFEEVPWSEGLKQYTPKAQGAAAINYDRSH